MFNENGYIDLFGIAHIIYIIVMIVLFIFGIYFLKKVKNKVLVVRILGIILFVLIMLNRYDCTIKSIDANNPNYFFFLPHSFCSMSSFIISLCAIFYKKSNVVIESLFVFALFGGISNIFYPNYIDNQYIWEIRTWTGLLHHALSAFIMIYLIAIGDIKPSIKKWYYFPFCAIAMMAIGYFQLYALKIDGAMNINSPLISSLAKLTNGWMLCLGLFIVNMAFLGIYELINKKQKK